MRALDSHGGYGVARTTVTVICGLRPNVSVQTTRVGPGQVRATLTAGQGALTGTLHLGQPGRPLVNARVDVAGGQSGITTAQDIPISGTQAVLTITRLAPGPVTVPLSVGDTCGEWRSFVGFGTSV